MTEQAARFVGSIPEHYDRELGPRIFAGFAADLAARTAAAQPGAVLELAAGTGIVSRALRDVLPAGASLLATDLNAPMLDVAQLKFSEGEAVTFQAVDATSLPFGDGSFDAAVCQFGVMFFPDKAASYREALRVLKSGGRYLFNVWDSWEHNTFAGIAHRVVSGFFPDDPPGFYRVPFSYCDTELIVTSLRQAGFDDVHVQTLELSSDVGSAQDFATGLVYGNPLFQEIAERGGDAEAVRHAIAAALEEEVGETMPLRAIVIEAQKER